MILNFTVHREDTRGPIYVSVDISKIVALWPGSFKTVALLGSTLAGVGRLIVRVFPFLAIHLSTWLKSIRLALSSSWMGGDCKMPNGFSDAATEDERMLQGCMQLSGVAIFYPRDDSQRVENPSIDGC